MKLSEYKQEIEFMAIYRYYPNQYLKHYYYDDEIFRCQKKDILNNNNYEGIRIIKDKIPYINCEDALGNKLYLFDIVKFVHNDFKNTLGICLNKNKIMWLEEEEKPIVELTNGLCSNIKKIKNIYELPEIQKQFNIEC